MKPSRETLSIGQNLWLSLVLTQGLPSARLQLSSGMESLPTLKLGDTEYTNISKPIVAWLPLNNCYEFDTVEEARAEMKERVLKGDKTAHHAEYYSLHGGEWSKVS
jgi:hypothetical protein